MVGVEFDLTCVHRFSSCKGDRHSMRTWTIDDKVVALVFTEFFLKPVHMIEQKPARQVCILAVAAESGAHAHSKQ